jgi:hypothetical protein
MRNLISADRSRFGAGPLSRRRSLRSGPLATIASSVIDVEDSAGPGRLCAGEVKIDRPGESAKDIQPFGGQHRIDHQPVLGDHPGTQQRMREPSATVGDDVASGLALERLDLFDEIAAGNPRGLPGGILQGSR